MNNKVYSANIETLRTLAILSVIFFHFFPKSFQYGYIGVDVFFVISGYLMISTFGNSSKSYISLSLNFYSRRILRIYPLYLTVIIILVPIAWMLFLDADFSRFITSVKYSLTGISNIYFWRTGGYFNTNDLLKPLLHTWSLSVELQTYILYPAIFYISLHLKKYSNIAIFVLICILYILTIILLQNNGSNPAFFLTPCRLWEFFLGSFAYIVTDRKFNSKIMMLCGFTLISFNFVWTSSFLPEATLAVLGSTIILLCKDTFFLNQKIHEYIISNIAKLSYSLYLVHWPIVSIIYYRTIDNPTVVDMLIGLIITFAIAFALTICVESKKHNFKFVILLGFIAIFEAFFFLNIKNNNQGYANKIASAAYTHFRCPIESYIKYGASRACILNDKAENYEYALVGNSHAQMYASELSHKLAEIGKGGILIPINGCLPTTLVNYSVECIKYAKQNLDAILADPNIRTVIVAMTWYNNVLTDGFNELSDSDFRIRYSAVENYAKKLNDSGKEFYIVGPIAIPGYDLPSIVSRELFINNMVSSPLKFQKSQYMIKFGWIVAMLNKKFGNKYINASEYLCDDEYCYYADDNGSNFSDSNHIGVYGLEKFKGMFNSLGM